MGSLLRNRKFREIFLQALMVSVVAGLLVAMVINTRASLNAQSLTTGFGFLERSTGWDFSFSVLPYSISDTYSKTLTIGILNTLLLGFLGIALATVFGVVIGLIRTSRNFLFSSLGTIYVETFRNVPLILQAVFWYSIVSHLPKPRAALSLGDTVFLTGRGIYFPTLNIGVGAFLLMVAVLIVWLVFLLFIKDKVTTAARQKIKWIGWLSVPAVWLIIAYTAHESGTQIVNTPALKGLNFRGGMRMPPELTALVIAIALYGGAYIGEVVRAGLMSVPRGQIEAG
ncbi:MAG: ABC transporter permease subunit, partial [Pseudomonadota bacterium]